MDSDFSGNAAPEAMNSQDAISRDNSGPETEEQPAALLESHIAEKAVGTTFIDNGAGTALHEEVSEPSATELEDDNVRDPEETMETHGDHTTELQTLDKAVAPQEDLSKEPRGRQVYFHRSPIGCKEESDFWFGQTTEPYAAPAEGWATILGDPFSTEAARCHARRLKVAKAAMELSLARIQGYNLEDLPEEDTYLKTLLKNDATEAQIREMEVRQAICQRHIAMLEADVHRRRVISSLPIPDLSYQLRCYFAHQVGVPSLEHSETPVFGMLAGLYRRALPVIDQILEALEEALSDETRWSDEAPSFDGSSQCFEVSSSINSYCGPGSEEGTTENFEPMADANLEELRYTDQKLMKPTKPTLSMRIRSFFGLRTSKVSNVEAGDVDCNAEERRPSWIRKIYERLYYRSSWVRETSDELIQVLDSVSFAWQIEQNEMEQEEENQREQREYQERELEYQMQCGNNVTEDSNDTASGSAASEGQGESRELAQVSW
jgi:hypothetical protein